jgi:hypothetical protein
MQYKHTLQRLVIASSCLFAAPVTCNSIFAKKTAAADSEYDYVQDTGSNLMKRVPKGSTSSGVGSSNSSSTSGEALRNFTQSNTSLDHRATGR